MVKHGTSIWVSALVILLSAPALSAPETTASLRGTVVDPSGTRAPRQIQFALKLLF
jgi:hypothetical protein